MTEKKHDKEMDALKGDIARLREELVGLADGVKKSAGIHAEQSRASGGQGSAAPGEDGLGIWEDLLHKFDSSRVQGEKVVRGLAAEVEQQPLVSILAAFGLGYIIAKLWYQGARGAINEDANDAL